MASARRDGAFRQLDRLFGEGTLAGLTDARLLERYITHRDELAFEALVRRHGPMVLGACRRVLGDPNDADDAFQAAFLLLARKAGSIRNEDGVGGWLHRVAWRIALQVLIYPVIDMARPFLFNSSWKIVMSRRSVEYFDSR